MSSVKHRKEANIDGNITMASIPPKPCIQAQRCSDCGPISNALKTDPANKQGLRHDFNLLARNGEGLLCRCSPSQDCTVLCAPALSPQSLRPGPPNTRDQHAHRGCHHSPPILERSHWWPQMPADLRRFLPACVALNAVRRLVYTPNCVRFLRRALATLSV